MLDRGAARPSTAPVPGPRAGRCAAPAPRTANARRDPGPIVGSLRRLGWGRVHDASRPGGSGAGTARRGAPRPAFSSQTLRAYSPGSCLLLRAGHVQFTSPREVMRSTTAVRPGVPPGRPEASNDSAGQTVVEPRKGPGLRRPHPKLGCVQTRQPRTAMDVSAGQGLVVGLPGLEPGTSSLSDRGLSAVRTALFPGRWRASGAKGCVLSDLVPSRARKSRSPMANAA